MSEDNAHKLVSDACDVENDMVVSSAAAGPPPAADSVSSISSSSSSSLATAATETPEVKKCKPQWQEWLDEKTGVKYYHNADTDTTTWTAPEEYIPISEDLQQHSVLKEMDDDDEDKSSSSSSGTSSSRKRHRSASPSPPLRHFTNSSHKEQEKLPTGWASAIDASTGKTYYYHQDRRQTSWDRPREKERREKEKPKGSAPPPPPNSDNSTKNGKEKRKSADRERHDDESRYREDRMAAYQHLRTIYINKNDRIVNNLGMLFGRGGDNLKHIQNETQCNVKVFGQGAYKEKQGYGPLRIVIRAKTPTSLDDGVQAVHNLMREIETTLIERAYSAYNGRAGQRQVLTVGAPPYRAPKMGGFSTHDSTDESFMAKRHRVERFGDRMEPLPHEPRYQQRPVFY